jgi:hypothetical protein
LVRIPIFAFDAPATFSLGTGSRADGIGYFSSSTLMPASFRICLMLMSIALMTFTSGWALLHLLGAIDLHLAVVRQSVLPAAVPDGREVGGFLEGAGQLRAGQIL